MGLQYRINYFTFKSVGIIILLSSIQIISIINARSSQLKFCDRVCTQSKKIYEDILASLGRKNVGWKMVYTFLGKDEKTRRNLKLTFP